jgi:RimJ/RimL family protein N-acetyltransferase
MITIVPTLFSHVKQLQQLEGLFFAGIDDSEYAKVVVEGSTAFSMVDGDQVLACGGVIRQWSGVGIWWLIVGQEAKKHPRRLLLVCIEMMEKVRAKGHFHRFQLYVNPDEPRHIRFAEALGFTFEGRMIKHTLDGKDHLLYARTY